MKIIAPRKLSLPSALGGDDQMYGLVTVCATRGIIVQELPNDRVMLDGINDATLLTHDIVALLLSKGAVVYDYPVFFKIDDIGRRCPFGKRGETWQTWGVHGESHRPVKIGDHWYRSNQFGEAGEHLTSSAWVPLMVQPPPGVSVVSVAEFIAARDAEVTDDADPGEPSGAAQPQPSEPEEGGAAVADEPPPPADDGQPKTTTYRVLVDDPDGEWAAWFNDLLDSIDPDGDDQFDVVGGKPVVTTTRDEATIEGLVARFREAFPDYATVQYETVPDEPHDDVPGDSGGTGSVSGD